MAEATLTVNDDFSLAHFAPATEGFQPPAGAFDPSGAWETTFDLWETTQRAYKVGAFSLTRTPVDGERFRLEMRLRKLATLGSQYCIAGMTCATDALATPLDWELETVLCDDKGQPIEETRLRETGLAVPGGLRVRIGDRERTVPVQGPMAFWFGLFEAVQRRSAPDAPALEFTLIDRFNQQVKPRQKLAFRRAATIELGGKRVWRENAVELEAGTVYRPVEAREGAVATKVNAWEQTGFGVLPTVYWVDDAGRLLMVLSGIAAYVYKGPGQKVVAPWEGDLA